MKSSILLTGATGFLGSNLLKAFLEDFELIVLKRSSSNLGRIKPFISEITCYDIDDVSISTVFQNHKIDYIIHTACNYGRKNESITEIVNDNLIFGLRLLELSIDYNVKAFINTDTFLPKEINSYSLSKKNMLDWLIKFNDKIKVVNVKLEHMYGPKDSEEKFVTWLINQFKQNIKEIRLTSGIQKRDFIYIDDVTSAYLYILKNICRLPNFSEFELGTGKSIKVKTFIENVKHEFEKQKGPVKTRLNFGAIPYRKNEIMEFKVKTDALRDLGWEPKIGLQHGIKLIIKDI